MQEAGPRYPAKPRKRAAPATRTASARSGGLPARRQRAPRPTPEQQRERRIEATAEFCADSLTSSWREAVADRATDYVTDTTWRYLTRTRHRRQCRALAKIASAILTFKKRLHDSQLTQLRQLRRDLIAVESAELTRLYGTGDITATVRRDLRSRLDLEQVSLDG